MTVKDYSASYVWSLLHTAKTKLDVSFLEVDETVGGMGLPLDNYPEEVIRKLKMLTGPHGKTIYAAMKARKLKHGP